MHEHIHNKDIKTHIDHLFEQFEGTNSTGECS